MSTKTGQIQQIEVRDLGLYGFQIEGKVLDHKRRTVTVSQDREVVPFDEFERHYILEVLKITNYQISGDRGAAALLRLPPSTLYSKMKKLGIKRP